MRILSLDISTHTGWSVFDNERLIEYGKYNIHVSGYKAEIKSYKDYPASYPKNFIDAANSQENKVNELLKLYNPDAVVIEETNKSRQRFSQKILEWMHFTVVSLLLSKNQKFGYITTTCWRKQTNCYMKDWPEYKKWNYKVSQAKKTAKLTKSGSRVAKINGKVVSAINQKKLSVILANNTIV